MQESRIAFRECIREDLLQLPGHSAKARDFFRWYFLPQGSTFRLIFWFRIVQYLRCYKGGKILSAIPYIIMRHYEFKLGVHANANVSVGKGLNIVHGDGVFLNVKSIGDYFTVYQGVTLGVDKNGGVPTIGNGVTIYPNAVVVGNITIGDNAVIGANAYVHKNVMPNDVVAGLPAQSIRREIDV
ncbi:MAG: serine O-acetyltransferase [Lachnospiraceae bacterium]|nr:serine O-acetyltransferase [Lachnospiraceae bacterium]